MAPTKSSRSEIKRDSVGVSEKLRRHAGNVPVLPQTKLCPQCPAKFTRSTHLNRHLKTHSAERMHKCEQCGSDFTRTDLLSRHKKTCNGVSRSRRKSCAPCAESKIKCDLAFPCDRCVTRGKECVAAAPKKARRATATDTPPSDGPSSSPNSLPPKSEDNSDDHGPTSYFQPTDWRSQYGGETASGVTESARDETATSALTYDSSASVPQLSSMYQSNMFDPLFNGLFSQSGPTSAVAPSSTSYSWLNPTTGPAVPSVSNSYSATIPHVSPAYVTPHVHPKDSTAPYLGEIMFGFGEYGQNTPHQQPSPPIESAPVPQVADYSKFVTHPQAEVYIDGFTVYGFAPENIRGELDEYMHLFWTEFTPQMPILHAPTWTPQGKPDYLIAAMRACGALYVRTRVAGRFIRNTLVAARRRMNTEFAKTIPDAQTQSWMFLTVALLQAVGIFHQDMVTRESHLSFQTLTVQMIRRYGVVAQNAAWRVMKHHDAASLRTAWINWAEHEVTKRAIMLSLVHDCCHLIYFGIPALFSSAEFDLNLPTDCDMWTAATPEQWLHVQNQPSVYGWSELRVYGYPVQKALQALADSRRLDTLTQRARINPLGLWILIHAILRNLYELAPDVPTSGRSGFYPGWSAIAGASADSVHYVLRNWLETWFRTPESAEWRDGRELPFMCDALPFYWLGQVSLLAFQERLPPFAPGAAANRDARFRLVKTWLRRVRGFLHHSAHEPTVVWNEMMKIRLQALPEPDADGNMLEVEDGLLGFFDKTTVSPGSGHGQ